MAAAIEESGTGMTRSASAGASSASMAPSLRRTAWIFLPFHTESGLEKYTYSKLHAAICASISVWARSTTPFSVRWSTVLGGISSISEQPMTLRAEVSEATA